MAYLRRQWGLGVVIVMLVGGSVLPSQAEDLLPRAGTWEVGLKSGYLWGLRKHADMVPINLRLGYTVFRGQWWIIPSGAFEVGAEPFVSVITSLRPHTQGDVEMGLGLPVLTYYFDTGTRLAPFIEGGLGVMYTPLRGYHLGGHFSFTECVGLGASYFLSKNVMINAAWRYRHISNANLYDDNAGLDSGVFLAGISYFLPQ